MFEYFYNKSLRKLVVGFGALFNEIEISHPNPDDSNNPKRIRVPITYAPQEKFIRRLLEPSSITDGTRIETQLPKMSYIITTISQDSSRRRNKFSPVQKFDKINNVCEDSGKLITEEVPINVGFSLFVYTRHIDDTLQIFEQIIPYFNPDHIISLSFNNVKPNVNIPITMISNNISERYDGDFSSRRINISSLTFLAKSYIYGPVRTFTTIDSTEIELDLD